MQEGFNCGGKWSRDVCRRAWQRSSQPLGSSCSANQFSGGRLHRDGSLAERGGKNLALGVRRARLLLWRAESSVLPAKRQQLLRAFPENHFCNHMSQADPDVSKANLKETHTGQEEGEGRGLKGKNTHLVKVVSCFSCV